MRLIKVKDTDRQDDHYVSFTCGVCHKDRSYSITREEYSRLNTLSQISNLVLLCYKCRGKMSAVIEETSQYVSITTVTCPRTPTGLAQEEEGLLQQGVAYSHRTEKLRKRIKLQKEEIRVLAKELDTLVDDAELLELAKSFLSKVRALKGE